jgi:hypothetical protein
MSLFEVLDQRGIAALGRFTAALVVFVVLYAARAPLVWLVGVLTAAMCRADTYATHTTPHQHRKETTGHVYAT